MHTQPVSSLPTPLLLTSSFLFPHLCSLRCCITIMASCDGDVLGSSMEMQHATVHIIRAECIRCHLYECMTVRSLCVKLFCEKWGDQRDRGRVTGSYCTFHLQHSLGNVMRLFKVELGLTERWKKQDGNGFFRFVFVLRFTAV